MTQPANLKIYAFAAGFILMVFEMAAARILSPAVGSSTYVWTSIIGVIVLALSVGYWYGGRIADMRGKPTDIAILFLVLAMTIAGVLVFKGAVLDMLTEGAMDVRLQAFFASLLLFAPASFVAGFISPYLAKLNVTSLVTSGKAVADLGALNSIGGIVGTFLAGYILFGVIGVWEVIAVLAVVALVMSWTMKPRWRMRERLVVTGIIGALIMFARAPTDVIAIDTSSSHYSVTNQLTYSGEQIHLATGPGAVQSGVNVSRPDELIFWYTQQMAEIVEGKMSEKGRILVLGGGAYTLPRYLAHAYPDSQIDVVEIDPELVDVSRKYFFYDDPPAIATIAADARQYINHTDARYDIVLVDVFNHDQTPFTFVTKEYGEALRRIVKPEGIVAVNIIGGAEGACRELLEATLAPYTSRFSHGFLRYRSHESASGNIIAVFGPESWRPPQGYALVTLDKQAFTDNFAPTERIHSACSQS